MHRCLQLLPLQHLDILSLLLTRPPCTSAATHPGHLPPLFSLFGNPNVPFYMWELPWTLPVPLAQDLCARTDPLGPASLG